MKASISYWTIGGFEGAVPVAQAAKTVQELGFDGIELSFGQGELTPETETGALRTLGDAVRAAGVEVSGLCTGAYWGFSLASPDADERQHALRFTEAYIRAARALGTNAVLVLPGTVDVPWDSGRPVVPASVVRDLALESLAALLPVAEAEDVVIALENVWNKFLTGPFEFQSFIESIGSRHVRAYFDVGNVVINGYPEDWIHVLHGLIERIHVKNFTRRGGAGTLDDFTGSLLVGDVNWEAVFGALRDIRYDGYLTAEMLVTDRGLPDLELAREVARDLRRLIEQYA